MTVELTLALPAYNEQDNIRTVVEDCIRHLEAIGKPWELIVIDNYSDDATPDLVLSMSQDEPRLRLVRHEENRLYSGSCATAIREAVGNHVAIMDSDGQMDASDLQAFLEMVEAGNNLVLGWRRDRQDPRGRLIVSWIFNMLGKWYLKFPLHDLNCGFRMFDRQFAAATEIRHRINMANPELYVRAVSAGLTVAEIPVEHHERHGGGTSHDFRRFPRIFRDVRRYLLDLRSELRQAKKKTQ